MSERRALIEGISPSPAPVDARREREFVFGAEKVNGNGPSEALLARSRVAFSTRLRADYAQIIKRASLERRLNEQEPASVQDILEAALEPWLRENGYLP